MKSKENPTFFFWLTLLNLEILLLEFVRSVRQGNNEKYKDCLRRMLPWFFILDRQNYARWLAVHWADLEDLEKTVPAVHEEFLKGRRYITSISVIIIFIIIIIVDFLYPFQVKCSLIKLEGDYQR